ncbi:co-chaperone YbbN [Micrococcoides hystricis]|uniref:Tetratricopeptide repeat protein n=1 Tax=Micrococcoides hystricis TaxID=1572761 RepID=A0ABV6PBU4_9MICC
MTNENTETSTPAGTQGAVDLSAAASSQATGAPAPEAGNAGASWVQELTAENFQQVAQLSGRVLVIMSLTDSTTPEAAQINDVLAEAVNEQQGRALLAVGDLAKEPQLLQVFGVPQGPLVVALMNGQPVPIMDRPMPREHVDQVMGEVLKACIQQGITGTVPPVSGGEPAEELSPEHQRAQEAIDAGDYDAALEAYKAALNNKPDDEVAEQGIAQVSLLKRVADMDAQQVRERAAAEQDDVQAQIAVADLDVVGGHVDDAFKRLVNYIATHFGDDRETARKHLVELYAVVGVHDPRVNVSRQKLSRVLF